MPGVFDQFAVGYRELVFLSEETTYGTIVHPAAIDAVQIITAALQHTQGRTNRADKTTSRSIRDRFSGRISATWSLNLYNLPSGTNGVAPDIFSALKFGFGLMKAVPSTLATAGATTSAISITAGAGVNYDIGDAIGWVNAAGELEVGFITAIATDTLTIDPPFSAAPAVGNTIRGSVTFKPANVLGSLTVTRILDNYEDVYPGAFVNTMSFVYPANGAATITVGGDAATSYSAGSSSLAVAALAGDATFTVQPGEGGRFQPNTRHIIGTEVVLVTGVAADVLAVLRAQAGTTAAGHAISDTIGPYEPPSTVAGQPVDGTIGDFFISGLLGTTRPLAHAKMQTSTLNWTNNGALRNAEFGRNSASGFTVKKRDITFDVTLWLEPQQAKLYNDAKKFSAYPVTLQLGKGVGTTTAYRLPKAEFNIPRVDGGGDDEVSLPLTGVGLATLINGNDEAFMAYL